MTVEETQVGTTPVLTKRTTVQTDIAFVENSLIKLLANRNVHKLAGTALAGLGLSNITTPSGWKELTVGAIYAAIMHVVGGIKKLPD